MSSNEQRREAAKDQLTRRNERAVVRAKRRKRVIIFSSIGLVVAVLVAGGVVWWNKHEAAVEAAHKADVRAHTCAYKPKKAERKQLPKSKRVGTPPNPYGTPKQGTVPVRFDTNRGAIPVTLDRSKAPCTVQSLKHLVDNHFYDDTKCLQEVNAPKPVRMQLLECGAPTGKGGGAGYTSPDELKAVQQLKDAPKAIRKKVQGQPVKVYPRGSVVMANDGKNSNSSQFFFVFGDTYLPPKFNLVGTVGDKGLRTLEKISDAGITPGKNRMTGQPTPEQGKPKKDVTVTEARTASPS